MASLSTCHLGLWLGWQLLLNLVKVGVFYRPEEDQTHMLQKINNSINTIENSNCLLLGDFNSRKMYWSKGEGNSQLEKSFIDTVNDNCLVQMVDKPTRGNNTRITTHFNAFVENKTK